MTLVGVDRGMTSPGDSPSYPGRSYVNCEPSNVNSAATFALLATDWLARSSASVSSAPHSFSSAMSPVVW
jgi:hypothetical protein